MARATIATTDSTRDALQQIQREMAAEQQRPLTMNDVLQQLAKHWRASRSPARPASVARFANPRR